MRKAVAAIAALSLLLVGCATAVGGSAGVDPAAQQVVAAKASAAESLAEASSLSSSTSAFTSTSMSRPTATTTVSSSSATAETTATSTETSTESQTEPTEIVPPPSSGSLSTDSNGEVQFDGFQYFDFDDGLYLRWAEDYEYQCADGQVDGCWGVLIFSVTGCADGVKVTLSISGDDSVTIGTVTGTTGGLEPNTQQLLILGDATGYAGDPLAYVDSAACLS